MSERFCIKLFKMYNKIIRNIYFSIKIYFKVFDFYKDLSRLVGTS